MYHNMSAQQSAHSYNPSADINVAPARDEGNQQNSTKQTVHSPPPPSGPTLSFPRDIFATLAPSQFLLAHLAPSNSSDKNVRPNGRTPSTFRRPFTNAGSLTHCNGSAVVRLGDTAAVCGVRAEILLARDVPNPPKRQVQPSKSALPGGENDRADETEDEIAADAAELTSLGLLVPNVELGTGCSPAHLPTNAPSAQGQSLAHRILSLLRSTRLVRCADLQITRPVPAVLDDGSAAGEGDREDLETAAEKVEVVAYWTLYVDVVFISLDGAAFDAAWGAVLAALRDLKLPRAAWDDEVGAVICSEDAAEARTLRLRGLPVAATFAAFGQEEGRDGGKEEGGGKDAWLLADPDAFEEKLCRESVTAVVDLSSGTTRIKRIEKNGGGGVDLTLMMTVVREAQKRWIEWHEVLMSERSN